MPSLTLNAPAFYYDPTTRTSKMMWTVSSSDRFVTDHAILKDGPNLFYIALKVIYGD